MVDETTTVAYVSVGNAPLQVAYLNVDVGVSGPQFWASATPSLDQVVEAATKLVLDPDHKRALRIWDSFRGCIGR